MQNEKTIHKIFFVWDFEKEEQWLNTMAQSGWLLDRVSFCTYHFVACTPGAYTIRMEMHGLDDEYLRFMQETGAEYVGRMVQWIYFRKKVQYGQFDIFSDLDSKIAHLGRISTTLALIGGTNLLIGMVNSFNSTHFGWVNLLCATLLMYALGRIHGKREFLQTQRLLQE